MPPTFPPTNSLGIQTWIGVTFLESIAFEYLMKLAIQRTSTLLWTVKAPFLGGWHMNLGGWHMNNSCWRARFRKAFSSYRRRSSKSYLTNNGCKHCVIFMSMLLVVALNWITSSLVFRLSLKTHLHPNTRFLWGATTKFQAPQLLIESSSFSISLCQLSRSVLASASFSVLDFSWIKLPTVQTYGELTQSIFSTHLLQQQVMHPARCILINSSSTSCSFQSNRAEHEQLVPFSKKESLLRCTEIRFPNTSRS